MQLLCNPCIMHTVLYLIKTCFNTVSVNWLILVNVNKNDVFKQCQLLVVQFWLNGTHVSESQQV